jgi:hypothetical protein
VLIFYIISGHRLWLFREIDGMVLAAGKCMVLVNINLHYFLWVATTSALLLVFSFSMISLNISEGDLTKKNYCNSITSKRVKDVNLAISDIF